MFASLEGREWKTSRDYDLFAQKHDAVMEIVYQITALSRSIAENKSEVIKLEGQLEALQPWLGLDLPMRFKGTGQTRAFIGTLPGGMDLEAVLTGLARAKSRPSSRSCGNCQFLPRPDLCICSLP